MSDTRLPPVVIEIIARHDKMKAGVDGAVGELEGFEKKATGVFHGVSKVGGIALASIATGLIGVGMKSLDAGMNFQESMTQLITGAGESESNIKMVGAGILDMAGKVGIGAQDLSAGMYFIESAGQHGADGLLVLKAAAEGAKVGNADLASVSKGLTTVLTDYAMPAGVAALVTSKLVATVASGKTTMEELSTSISTLAPIASAAGISLDQMLAGMATMTGEGISAQQSAQDLASTIKSLQNPTSVATKTMAQMGLSSLDVSKNLGRDGLTGTMAELSQAVMAHMGPAGLVLQSSFNESKIAAASAREELSHLPASLQALGQKFLDNKITAKDWTAALHGQDVLTASLGKQFAMTAKHASGFNDTIKAGGGDAKTYAAMLADMTGGSTGLDTILALTGTHAGTLNDNLATVAGTVVEVDGSVKGFTLTQGDLKTKMDQVHASLGTLEIKLGEKLIPLVEDAVVWFGKHKDIAEGLAVVVGGVLVLAMATYVGGMVASAATAVVWGATMLAAGTMALLPFLPIILAVAAVIGIGYELWKNWDAIWGFVKRIVADGVAFVKDHLRLVEVALILITGPIGLVGVAAYELWQNWDVAWTFMQRIAMEGVKVIADLFMGMVDIILHGAADAFGWIPGIGPKLNDAAKAFDHFKDGVNNSLNSIIADKTIAVHVVTSGLNGINDAAGISAKQNRLDGFPGNATGTDSWTGGMTWVGEKGPELINLARGAQVIPNHMIGQASVAPMTSRGNGGGGGGTSVVINLNGPVFGDMRRVAQELSSHVRDELLKQGRGLSGAMALG